MITQLSALLTTIAVLTLPALASAEVISDHPHRFRNPTDFDQRLVNARSKCMDAHLPMPVPTFNQPNPSDAKHYKQSYLMQLTDLLVYTPIYMRFAGPFQLWLNSSSSGAETQEFDQFIEDARRYAVARGYKKLQKACLTGCILSEMLQGEEVTHFTSFDLAISQGMGDCKHYAFGTHYILEKLGVGVEMLNSLDHAYNRISHRGTRFLYDTSWGAEFSCNFFQEP